MKTILGFHEAVGDDSNMNDLEVKDVLKEKTNIILSQQGIIDYSEYIDDYGNALTMLFNYARKIIPIKPRSVIESKKILQTINSGQISKECVNAYKYAANGLITLSRPVFEFKGFYCEGITHGNKMCIVLYTKIISRINND